MKSYDLETAINKSIENKQIKVLKRTALLPHIQTILNLINKGIPTKIIYDTLIKDEIISMTYDYFFKVVRKHRMRLQVSNSSIIEENGQAPEQTKKRQSVGPPPDDKFVLFPPNPKDLI